MSAVDKTLYPEDRFGVTDALSEAEQATLRSLRGVIDEHIRPLLDDHWERGEFPTEALERLIALDLMDPPALRDAGEQPSALYRGLRTYELARTDVSLVTGYLAQAGLFRTTVALGGSDAQLAELDPRIRSFAYRGVFALTEPDHGSDIAGGLATSARREGEGDDVTWVITGAKRWIGGAFTADVLAVFARDEADGQVKCFLVPREADGVTLTKIERKISLRSMQNADIALENVRVPESARLQQINSFKDVARCLRNMRSDVAWVATGAAAGAFTAALDYTRSREQFGVPLAGFQLVQEKLARMQANVVSALGICATLTAQQERGDYRDENSALAKMQTSLLLRETAALAREVCGGNGITLDSGVARFFADAEAVYSYEGTHEINALIVGRALTGIGAFR